MTWYQQVAAALFALVVLSIVWTVALEWWDERARRPGCMVPTLLVEVERLTQELDRANTAHARALVRYSQDPLLQRIIDTEAERDAAEDVLRWLVSLDAPGSAARASVTVPDIIARAKVVLRVQDELGACGKPADLVYAAPKFKEGQRVKFMYQDRLHTGLIMSPDSRIGYWIIRYAWEEKILSISEADIKAVS